MPKDMLIVEIGKRTVISELEYMRDTGLAMLVGVNDIEESDIAELTAIINARIAELAA